MDEKSTERVAGIMSGTSLDGLDIAVCTFNESNGWSYEIEFAKTYPYPDALTDKLAGAMELASEELHALSIELGEFIADRVNELDVPIDLIASHGHTVFHDPKHGVTVQIGDGPTIANKCNTLMINDFRSLDVSLGGQGAPLVPIGDKLLFSQFDQCLNLGGISNISYEQDGQRLAHDICFVNMALNALAQRNGKEYDDNGSMAATGKFLPELYEKLNGLIYFELPAPKSLGKEQYELWIEPLLDRSLSAEDLLATFTAHIAYQLATTINKIGGSRVLVTGGGAYNQHLIRQVSEMTEPEIHIPDRTVIDFKEALVFALLGYLRKHERINCLASVTGASRDSSCGTMHWPN